MASLYQIGGVDIRAPLSWQLTRQPVTTPYSDQQTLDGSIHRSLLGWRDTFAVSFPPLTDEELWTIETMISCSYSEWLYPSEEEGGASRQVFTVSKYTAPLAVVRSDGVKLWRGLSFTLTGVNIHA